MKKLFSFIATLSLLANSLFAPLSVLAQEASPSPTPAPITLDSPSPTPTPTPEIPALETTPTPISTPTLKTSEASATPVPASEWTFENVELNKEYENSGVKLTFTKLPENSGNIKIEEITLTPEQIKQTGSLSDKAYDITSDMADGSFAYNLTLPVPESAKDKSVDVKFAEDISEINSAQTVDNTITNTDTSISVSALDHFTIFVVTVQTPDYAAPGTSGVYSAYYGPSSDAAAAVSPGETTIYNGREAGIIKAGLTASSDGHYWDEGLFGFIPTVTIDDFAAGTVTYDVQNQTGVNPVWMTIEIDTGVIINRSDNTTYQFVPASYGTANGYHTVDAAAGLWQKWNDDNGNVTNNPLISLSQVATDNKGKNIVRAYLRLGMGDSYYNSGTGTIAWVDKATFGGETYDFKIQPACNDSSFDLFNLGSVNGQGGWSATGVTYDQAIVDNVYGYSNFGCKSLRVSNAVTSGSFDWIFSNSLINEAGETSAFNSGFSGGTRQNHFETQFDIASTIPNAQQSGLQISVSPDRGDGARMSYLRFNDMADGIHVFFDDYSAHNFRETDIATLDRSVPHTIKIVIDFIDGANNDVVKVYIDDNLKITGTSWEGYFIDNEVSIAPPTVDSLLIQARNNQGGSVPANLGNGFLFDNISLSSSTILSDTTPPSIPMLTYPINGINIKNNAPLMQWDNSIDTESGVAGYDYQIYYNCSNHSNIPSSCPSIFNHPTTGSEYQAGTTSDGTYYWRVRAKDNAGNISGWSELEKVIIDTQAPGSPTLISPANNTLVNGNPTQTWTSVSDAHHYIYASYSDEDGNHQIYSTPINDTSRIVGGNQTLTFYWRVRAVDAAGNESGWSEMRKLIVDNTAPTTPTIFGFLNPNLSCGAITNIRYITVDWSDSDDASGIVGYDYSIDYPLSPGPGRGTWNTIFSISQNWGSLNEGVHYIKVRAKDSVGNVSDWSNICSITYDKTAPVVQITNPPEGIVSGTVDIRGTVTDANPHHYWLAIYSGSTAIIGNTVNRSTSFTNELLKTWNTTLLPDGEYVIKLEARDAANNKDEGSVDWHVVTVDNTAPTGSWVYPINNATVSGAVTLNFTPHDNLSGVAGNVVYKYKAVGETSFRTDSNIVGNSWNTTGLTLGDYILRAIVTDNAGNVAGDGGEFDITVGVAALVSDQNAVGTSTGSITVTWTTDRPTTSRVVFDTVSHSTLGTDANYGYASSTVEDTNKVTDHSVTINGLSPGTPYYYRVISHGSPTAVGGEGYAITLTEAGPPMASGGTTGGILGTSTGGLLASTFPQLATVTGSGEGTENTQETTPGAESNPAGEPEVLGTETSAGNNTWKIISIIVAVVLAAGYGFYRLNKKAKSDTQ